VDPFQVGALQEVLTTLIIAGSGLGALALFLRYRRPRGGGGGPELAELTRSVDGLRASIEQMRGELAEVHDRLDFTERLLAQVTQQPRELRSP